MKWITTWLVCLYCSSVIGQVWIDKYNQGATMHDIENYMQEHYGKQKSRHAKKQYKEYRRWLISNSPYLSSDKRPAQLAAKIIREKEILKEQYGRRNDFGQWTDVTPANMDDIDGGPRYGVVWDLSFDRLDPNILYAGTEGGLWRKNGSGSWEFLTDNILADGVSGIVAEGSTIYIITGSKSNCGSGIYRSLNNGLSWDPVSSLGVMDACSPGRGLIAHPNNVNIQLAWIIGGASKGLYITYDGWLSYEAVYNSTTVYDVKFHPSDPNQYYFSSALAVYKGNIDTESYSQILNWPDGYMHRFANSSLAVSPQAGFEDALYVMFAHSFVNNGTFYHDRIIMKTLDGGSTVDTVHNDVNNPPMGQPQWNLELAVNPTNFDDLIMSDVDPDRSIDGGATWEAIAQGPRHDDAQDMLFHQGILYMATDGGIQTNDLVGVNPNWNADINEGLKIQTISRFDVFDGQVITGNWHSGHHWWSVGDATTSFEWTGDGFGCFIDYNSPTDKYYMGQAPNLYRTIDGGAETNLGAPVSFEIWGQPLMQDPQDPSVVWYCANEIYRWDIYNPTGVTWVNTGLQGINRRIRGFDVMDSNSDIGYFVNNQGGLYKFVLSTSSTDVNNTPPGLGQDSITSLIVDHENDNEIWISCETWGNNLWYSNDSGETITEVGSNLPDVPIYDIARISENNQLFVATLYGVWYTNDDLGDEWMPFIHGLGYKRISGLDIDNGYLYAAAWGHGVYRTPLPHICPSNLSLTDMNDPDSGHPGYQRYSTSNMLLNSRNSIGNTSTDVMMQSEGYIRLTQGFRATTLPSDSLKGRFLFKIEACIQD